MYAAVFNVVVIKVGERSEAGIFSGSNLYSCPSIFWNVLARGFEMRARRFDLRSRPDSGLKSRKSSTVSTLREH